MTSNHRSRSRARAGGWLALLAATFVLGGTAIAATVSRTQTRVEGGAVGSAKAKCKGGRSALSGGFAAPGFNPDSDAATVARLTSKRVGKRGIKTRAFNFGSEAGDIVSFAYCGKPARPPSVRSKSVQVPPAGQRSTIAKCAHGSEAIGGGFATSDFSQSSPSLVLTLTSRRRGTRGWKVTGFNINDSSGAAGRLTAYAYCKRPKPNLRKKSKTVTTQIGSLRTVKVKCPHGFRALSGGFDGEFAGSPMNSAAAPAITSKRGSGGRAWFTSALGVVSSEPATLTAYAYCRRR